MTTNSSPRRNGRREGWREAPNAQDQLISRLAILTMLVILACLALRFRG